MSPLHLEPAAAALVARLSPYGRRALEAAGDHALLWHARTTCPEHLLWELMRDDDAAAHRAVVHAFADPESIAVEALALCEGLFVVGSGVTLPFSVRTVRALFAARALADASNAAAVGVAEVLEAALGELPELAAALELPLRRVDAAVVIDPEAGHGLFRGYSQDARRCLSQGCKLAHRLGRTSIAPAHILMCALEQEPELGARFGLAPLRVRAALAGRDGDPTPPAERAIGLDGSFEPFLAALPESSGTLGLLAAFVAHGSPEVQALLKRHRITAAMLEHAAPVYRDP
ncbi:MAG: hypothetical protein EPO68_15830 [Planctomycetota bacterium]|nr:MAG: hypothetical protein EPO68_15830 [Planctomycetota bacterium]